MDPLNSRTTAVDRPGRARFATMLDEPEESVPLKVYRTSPPPWPALVPAPSTRAWIERTTGRFARRCLPLMMANQAGWFLIGTHSFTAKWDGGDGLDSVRLKFESGSPPFPALSHFGHGIVTFHVPYLFRTPPGWNLLARGPSNWPKEGAVPLEGLVETDWSMATFTMNWKLTTRRPVTFLAGEPFCMVAPQRRGDLERFKPRIIDIAAEPDVQEAYAAWRDARLKFLAELNVPGSDAHTREWQKHYFRGTSPDGTGAPAHQTKLTLQAADDDAGWTPPIGNVLGP